jgi:hypothetical protein
MKVLPQISIAAATRFAVALGQPFSPRGKPVAVRHSTKEETACQVPVSHACNPSSSGGRD